MVFSIVMSCNAQSVLYHYHKMLCFVLGMGNIDLLVCDYCDTKMLLVLCLC